MRLLAPYMFLNAQNNSVNECMDEHEACEERKENIKPRSRRKIIGYDIFLKILTP